MTYKVSLIIPVWNAAKTISDCILSAIKAKNSPSEIIIVDDCSNDNTVSIIKNLITKYPYIKLLELKKNVGPAAARDLGVAASGVADGDTEQVVEGLAWLESRVGWVAASHDALVVVSV